MTTLTERLALKISKTFKRLNTQGKNPGGRFEVLLEIWASVPGDNPIKGSTLALADPDDYPARHLVPLDLAIKDIKGFDKTLNAVVIQGDARLEIAKHDTTNAELTRSDLMGQGLTEGQLVRYRIGDTLYTLSENGLTEDPDGLTWRLVLIEL